MGHVAILQGSIGYACGPVMMIPPRVNRLCFVSFKLFGQAAGIGLSPHPVAGFLIKDVRTMGRRTNYVR
jgi:hypothetical protein